MATINDSNTDTQSFEERRDIHLSKFNEFIEQIELAQKQGLLPDGMEIVVIDNHSLTIKHQRRELIVKFSFAVNSIDILRGFITCFKKLENPEREIEIYRLSFNEYGVADIPGGKPDDVNKINSKDVATKLFTHWVLLLFIGD